MAELDKSEIYDFAAAATALTISTGRKLIRNFSYYRTEKSDRIYRQELLVICIGIRMDTFSLHNLMTNNENYSPFFVAIAGQISDRLEELHRKLLFFDSDEIIGLIHIIDGQRTFWNRASDPEFYDEDLTLCLEHDIPESLLKIELELKRLPDSAVL